MNKELNSLLALEMNGYFAAVLEKINSYKSMHPNDSPISSLNLDLIEARIRSRKSEYKSKSTPNIQARLEDNKPATSTWTAIITMWKRSDYLAEQLSAIKTQSFAPAEIIIILNENHISEQTIRDIGGPDIRIVRSDVNSLYSRWAIAYIAKGEYVCVFDDDIIPGSLWIENAMRASKQYNALVGPSGRIYSKNGKHGYYKLVVPAENWSDKQTIDCGVTDVYCDWVCNSYLFKREWVGYALGAVRYQESFKTFDDIQLATSLYIYGGIQCITPMQPSSNKELHGSLKHSYGNDAHAIWKTNSDHHFSARKEYIESLNNKCYEPIESRFVLHRIHLIVPFGSRDFLERCLLSVKGQDYRNFTCTLIDDCQDGKDSLGLFEKLGLDESKFRYIKSITRLHPLKAREIATDLLAAAPADIIAHLDGDDWLPYPDTLSRLVNAYRGGNILATYGNTLSLRSHETLDFREFSEYEMSKRWNVSGTGSESPVIPFRELQLAELDTDWRNAPWCAMHMRTFQHIKWVGIDRANFLDKTGEYLQVATDAAIFLPILNSTEFKSIKFIPELMYVYQNTGNTIHARREVTNERRSASFEAIRNSSHVEVQKAVENALIGKKKNADLKDVTILHDFTRVDTKHGTQTVPKNSTESDLLRKKSAAITIVTPNYLADAVICLQSYALNIRTECALYIFLATDDREQISKISAICDKLKIRLLTPSSLTFTSEQSRLLIEKYSQRSDEYRWAMKAVVLIELLQRGFDFGLFLDPDTYTVSDVTDIHHTMLGHPISVFPHFRDPDHEYLRKVLYKDGFFNGGMLGATANGLRYLNNLFKRCLSEMTKDPARSRWDDQKYFDLFTLETPNLHVNLDRGIDYNPWNYERMEGLVAPSQRSYLLGTGFFVRHWHVSTMLIKNSIELNERKFSIFRPLVAIYLTSLLYLIILLEAHVETENDVLGLAARYKNINEKLKALSPKIPTEAITMLRNNRQSHTSQTDSFLSAWMESIADSVTFDNFGIFSEIVARLFPGETAFKVTEKLKALDLRYWCDTTEIPTTTGANGQTVKPLNAGEVVKLRLNALRSCGLNY